MEPDINSVLPAIQWMWRPKMKFTLKSKYYIVNKGIWLLPLTAMVILPVEKKVISVAQMPWFNFMLTLSCRIYRNTIGVSYVAVCPISSVFLYDCFIIIPLLFWAPNLIFVSSSHCVFISMYGDDGHQVLHINWWETQYMSWLHIQHIQFSSQCPVSGAKSLILCSIWKLHIVPPTLSPILKIW